MQQPVKKAASKTLTNLKNLALDRDALAKIKGGNCDILPPATQEVIGDHDIIGG